MSDLIYNSHVSSASSSSSSSLMSATASAAGIVDSLVEGKSGLAIVLVKWPASVGFAAYRHCEYQSLENLQVEPDAQILEPV